MSRISKYISGDKKRLLFKSFIISQWSFELVYLALIRLYLYWELFHAKSKSRILKQTYITYAIKVVLVSSLFTLKYFRSFPSFPIADFEQVNICWKIIWHSICVISVLMCLLEQGRINKKQCREFRYFSLTLSEMSCLQAFDYSNNSFKKHWKVCINANTNFWGLKNKAGICCESITWDHFPF